MARKTRNKQRSKRNPKAVLSQSDTDNTDTDSDSLLSNASGPFQDSKSIPETIPEEMSNSKISLMSHQAMIRDASNIDSTPSVQMEIPKFKSSALSGHSFSASIDIKSSRKDQQISTKQSSSISRSIPKSIPRRSSLKPATPTSLFMQAHRKSIFESDSDQEVDISEHLVQASDMPISASFGASFGSMSHALVGGAITRDIYKWHEDQQTQTRLRRNSEPDAVAITSPSDPSAAVMREPGGFRRDFIRQKAKEEGKKPPNFVTGNFIDFLVLYGFYGGDVYPSDDEYEDDEETRQPRGNVDDLEAILDTLPLLQRQPSLAKIKGTSEAKAFFMLLKAFVGTGVLFLPKAFMNGGILFSVIVMIFFGFLTTHCMLLLVETSRKFGGKSFGDLGEAIYGKKCRSIILGSIVVSQMGFCCAYFIFVGQNLRDLLMIISNCKIILPDWFFISLQLLLYIPLAWVRRIKNFGLSSLIADVFIMLGLGYIFCYDLVLLNDTGIMPVSLINVESFSLFIGTSMFAFEGICLILPIAESMKEPEKFSRVVSFAMPIIAILFISIGALGYLALGNSVETIVFLNLPKTPAVTALQFVYVIAIMLSFPLTVYPAIRITEQAIFGLSTGKKSSLIKWEKNLYRAAMTSILGLVAWAGSTNLDKVVSLVGCLACIPLSFIYPALFHIHTTKSKWVRCKDWAIVLFGSFATLYTSYITVQQWAANGPELPLDRCRMV